MLKQLDYSLFFSTSIEFRSQIVPISKADLKQLELQKICFNKNEKMLKQIRIVEDICNNWYKLGDKSAVFQGYVEANLIFL